MTSDQIQAFVTWLRGNAALNRALADALADTPAPAKRGAMLVPLYSRDVGEWDRLFAAGARVDVVAIANPNSGPGVTASAVWSAIIAKGTAAPGVTMIGYVSTRYGQRPPGEVTADIAAWYRLYPSIGGIFFDEQAKEPAMVARFAAYFADVKARGGYVASNPGVACDPGYLAAKPDAIVLWENTAGAGSPTLPTWAALASDGVCAGLVHHCPDASLPTVVAAMRATGFGLVFATSSPGPGTWSALGSGFPALVAALA